MPLSTCNVIRQHLTTHLYYYTNEYPRGENFREVIFSPYSQIVCIHETLTVRISPETY